MSDERASHPFDGPEPQDEFVPDLLPDLDEDLLEEESFYGELPEDWDIDVPDDALDDDPEIVAEVDGDGDRTAGTGPASVIVLSGPRSGTVVSRADTGDGTTLAGSPVARKVGSARSALAPGEVLMLVHRPGYYSARMPLALARVHADFSHTGLHVGISAGLPRKGSIKTKEYLDRCGAAAVRIADPEGYALPDDLVDDHLTETQRANVRYAAEGMAPLPGAASTEEWNQRVIQSQRAAGANVLLTPGRSLDAADSVGALEEAGRALDVLLDEVSDTEVPAWNLTLPAAWLTNEKLREQLLAELVDRDDVNVWHVRVRWPLARPSRAFGQPKAEDLLRGYRELATTARQEDRALLLPNTGLTGWLTLGWGSAGFGTGSSQVAQAWADTPQIKMKAGTKRPPQTDRHLVAALLHTITVTANQGLARTLPTTTYPSCPCPFCAAQAEAPTWQREIDAGHTVYAMGALAAEVAAAPRRSRATTIKSLVDGAQTLHDSLPGSALDTKEKPEHLARWNNLLP